MGLLALGEGMPSTLGLQALRLLSWLCITAGVSTLAGGRGVSMPASCAACLPLDQPLHLLTCCLPLSWLCITAGVSMLARGRGADQPPLWQLLALLIPAGSAALALHCQACSLCASRGQGGSDACQFVTLRNGHF